ncbi:Serine/threonine-protein kinase dclk3 [Physocladia obscura]|uniref:Serine/threonine-protein kinase dclk3 n=1 Tax=Physocladia obscura TaxID=109957 RepID=A0AAD5T5B2_9FUNG|nr:Serine/threonine-protein kinase dclk3 [Physocladia obscura]
MAVTAMQTATAVTTAATGAGVKRAFSRSRTSSVASVAPTTAAVTTSANANSDFAMSEAEMKNVRIVVPADIAALAGGRDKTQTSPSTLYGGLSSENKARVAVAQSFALSPFKMLVKYKVARIVGFGSNGVVLAASSIELSTPVAIKVIYKSHVSSKLIRNPTEIDVLKSINDQTKDNESSNIITYIEDWQDANHFYLVTELFGSDWLAASPASSDEMDPLVFKAVFENTPSVKISLPFSAGSSDLWAWSYAHRAHVWETSHQTHSMLPLRPIKQLIKQLANALSKIHHLGFYHGDIKVENVLVQSGGDNGPEIKLADFGHSKHSSFGIKCYGTQEVSVPEFLADCPYIPEMLDGRASDIFALGMVMFVVLNESGELPRAVKAIKSGKLGYDQLMHNNQDNGLFPFDAITDADVYSQNLLDGMCCIDPTLRLTIDQVLVHPWLSDA